MVASSKARGHGSRITLSFAVFGAMLSWSFTVPDYLVIETAFTAVQWAIVGPLIALAHARASRRPFTGPDHSTHGPRAAG